MCPGHAPYMTGKSTAGPGLGSWLGAIGLHVAAVAVLPSAPEAPPTRPRMMRFELTTPEPAATTPVVPEPVDVATPAPAANQRSRRRDTPRRARRSRPRPETSEDIAPHTPAAPAAQADAQAMTASPPAAVASTPAVVETGGATTSGASPDGQGSAGMAASWSGIATGGAPLRGPGLIAAGDPCAGYFPAGAAGERGVVRVVVRVDAHGHARAERVLFEAPQEEGFADAARACAARLRFTPAVDARGVAVPGRAKLELRFRRPDRAPA